MRVPILLLAILLAPPFAAGGAEHQLFWDFNTDDDLWTINPYSPDHGDISVILQVGDGPPIENEEYVFIVAGGNCYEESGEEWNCVELCTEFECNDAILLDCYLECPTRDCYGPPVAMGWIRPDFQFVPGERYLLGIWPAYLMGPLDQCDNGEIQGHADFDPGDLSLIPNPVWLSEAPSSVPDPDTGEPSGRSTTWGQIKSIYR